MQLITSFQRHHRLCAGDGSAPVGEDELRQRTPAIFARRAHEDRSARYQHISTFDMLKALAEEGFQPTFAAQSIPRKDPKGRLGYTKHMVRLRREADMRRSLGECPEVIVVNSHSGETGYQMLGGMFRFLCLNSMVMGENMGEIRVRHAGGQVLEEVREGALVIAKSFRRVTGMVERMKRVHLTEAEVSRLAEEAAALRLRPSEGESVSRAWTHEFALPRRQADAATDLWTVLSRVQENVIRGGMEGVRLDANGRNRRSMTRPITNITDTVRLNQSLWALGEAMLAEKVAA